MNFAEILKTYKEAINSHLSKQWKDSKQKGLELLEKNNTCQLLKCPEGKNVIGSKWVFNLKYLPNLKIVFQNLFVCKKMGADFNDTFSPTSRYDTIRFILATNAQENLKLLK